MDSSTDRPAAADTRKPTGADVAKLAGVSRTAVSQVFSGTGRISPDTARRVLAAADRLGYAPGHLARSLRLGRTGLLTMVIPQVDNPYYMEVYAGGQRAAAERGYELGMVAVPDDEAAHARLRHLATGTVDGVVLVGQGPLKGAEELETLRHRGIAVAAALEPSPAPHVPTVRVDVEQGARQAVRHLLGLGHRRIAHVTNRRAALAQDTDPEGGAARRLRGYREALAEAGIGFDPALVHATSADAAGGAAVVAALTARPGPAPTAVLAFNDVVAMGILHGLATAGFAAPGDLSVVGFDGIGLAEFTVPALTTVAHPREEIGRRAVTLVCDQLDGGEPRSDEWMLTPALVVRGSTGPVRA